VSTVEAKRGSLDSSVHKTMNTLLSSWLGIAFVLIGAFNVWLILQSSARLTSTKASGRLIAAHRIGGYVFIALFCLMAYYMFSRLGDASGGAAPAAIVHLTIAMVLSPLLFVKVLVARYYKNHSSLLMPIGLMIFVLSFVLIGVTAGPALAHHARMETVSLASIDLPTAAIDMNMAAKKMEERCSKCHTLDRIAGAHKDARGWLSTVNRMRALPDSGISAADAQIIISYLVSQMGPKGSPTAANLEVGRALVDQRCGRCHSLDRVYRTAEAPEEWRATVGRMVAFAAGSGNAIQPGEDEQIVAYLSATQTPKALNDRKAHAAAASSAGRSLVTEKAAVPQEPAPSSRVGAGTIGFLALVGLGVLTLIFRRPGRGTLRFILPKGRTITSRPGQFLTFSFLFDGKKVVRSYSICSSAARSGYVEITPKRMAQGCVSVFLNDRASVGMTVEAAGPFGQFYLDDYRHRNIVLLAGGSGITPMMAMLRYIDDLCLETAATLLYCVRTERDIIFGSELEELQFRLKSFRRHVMLSQPPSDWAGLRGHISRGLIESTVRDLPAQYFFICGPPPFMDASRGILLGLGVTPERIMQESFGAPPPAIVSSAAPPEAGAVIHFVRTGKACTVRSGQTVLEAAEEVGVAIPFSCRQGQCGTCKTKLLAGNVRMDAEAGLDPDSRAQGFVLTCVGRAEGEIKLDA
jgi:ferredoxin-NADP reductase/mono/diheme cytochrome c family protein